MGLITLNTKAPKAKKDHVCDWCGFIIKSGSKYQSQTNIYDGDLYVWKNHMECLAIAQKLNMFDDCDEGVTGADFCEYIDTQYHDLIITHQLEICESKDYRYPPFIDRLKYVFAFYKIENNL